MDLPIEILSHEIFPQSRLGLGAVPILRLVCRAWAAAGSDYDDKYDRQAAQAARASYVGQHYSRISRDDERFKFRTMFERGQTTCLIATLEYYFVCEKRINLSHFVDWWPACGFLIVKTPVWWMKKQDKNTCIMATDILLYRALVTNHAEFIDRVKRISGLSFITIPSIERNTRLIDLIQCKAIYSADSTRIGLMRQCKQTREISDDSRILRDANDPKKTKNALRYLAECNLPRNFKSCVERQSDISWWEALKIYLTYCNTDDWYTYRYRGGDYDCPYYKAHIRLIEKAAKIIGESGTIDDVKLFDRNLGISNAHRAVLVANAVICNNEIVLGYFDLRKICNKARVWKYLVANGEFGAIHRLSGMMI